MVKRDERTLWQKLDEAYKNKNGYAFFKALEDDRIVTTENSVDPPIDVVTGSTTRALSAIYQKEPVEVRDQYGVDYRRAASRGDLDSQEGALLEVEDDSPR